jgi:TRAP-type C4-dicarboxylate transport system substrate-binding protein
MWLNRFLGIALLLLSIQLHAEVYTLRIHHFLGAESLPHKGLLEPWAQRVEADSNGRLKIEIYPEMSLGGKAPQLLDQVSDGSVDIIWTAAAYTPDRFPHTEVFTLPLVHEGDPLTTNLAIMSMMGTLQGQDFQHFKPLLVHVQAGHALHLSRKQVTSIHDLNGLVIRPAGRRIGLWVLEALTAEASKKRHPKLSKALAEHKLDGALMSFQLAQSLDVIDSVTSHTMLGDKRYFGTSLYLFLMNPASYDRLPADLQAVIDRNSGLSLAAAAGRVWQQAENRAMAVAREQGHVINVLENPQQVGEMLETVHERWSASVEKHGIDGPALIQKAQRAIEYAAGVK